jgi:phenylalanyl-tRNA synthetase alpha chain
MSDTRQILQDIAAAADLAALETLRVAALGKSGSITALLKSLGAMDPETRAAEGPKIHALREAVTTAIADRKAQLEAADLDRRLATERIDLSLPAAERPQGTVHPVSQVMDELAEIFADLGFTVAEGPEIEDQWYNFTALNMPEAHPARAMHDTFYLEPRGEGEEPRVLRTHTSPVQIRAMQEQGAPLRLIAPGRVYRSDSDATHTPMFHQVEGLVIDRAIHMGHLKWTLETFLKAFFERDDVAIRMIPSYFPFTEPSADVHIGWSWENGRRVIGGSENWMEVLGSGMVNPRVIANCGLDPDEWQGFAFGTGVDRLAMLKYGMSDLRAFFDGDIRWLKHYGFRALDVPTLSAGIGA